MTIDQVLPGLEVTLINWAGAGQRRWTKAPIVSDPYQNIYEPVVPTVKIRAVGATPCGRPKWVDTEAPTLQRHATEIKLNHEVSAIYLDSVPLRIIPLTQLSGARYN